MQENLEIVYPTPGYSFCFQILQNRKLHFNWHRHREFEFLLCLRGCGQAHIANLVDYFEGPAAYFIGSNIAHGFASDTNFEGWIVQIPVRCFERIEGRPEFDAMEKMLKKASDGLCFSAETAAVMADKMKDCSQHSGLQLWLDLLGTLETGAHDHKPRLCSLSPSEKQHTSDIFDEVLTFIYNEYTRQHSLEEMAEKAHMSIPSFCRVFKKRLGLSYVEYLHSIRLNNAKKMLLQTKLYVDDICYECGFNNVSFFDRKFKENTGMTPREYRNTYAGEDGEIRFSSDINVPDENGDAVR